MIRRDEIKSIEIKNLSMVYDNHHYFENLTTQIPLGGTIVVDGPPGCGKSLLLKLISGIMSAEQGDILFNKDKNLRTLTYEEFDPFRLNIAFGFDNGGLLSNRTLKDNIILPLAYHGAWEEPAVRDSVEGLIKTFKIERFMNSRPAGVSAGVRKLAGIVRALAMEPQILCLDEPTVGIYQEALNQLVGHMNLMRQKNPLFTVIMASSDRTFCSKFAHALYWIQDKQLVFVNEYKVPPAEMLVTRTG